MAEIFLVKNVLGQLEAAHSEDKDYLNSLPIGQVYKANIVKPRNYKFHKKLFALFDVAFNLWGDELPEVEIKGEKIRPQKNAEQFREWSLVNAGYYDVFGYPNGAVRVRAQSLSYAAKDQDQIETIYNRLLDFYLNDFLAKFDRQEIERAVNQLINFA